MNTLVLVIVSTCSHMATAGQNITGKCNKQLTQHQIILEVDCFTANANIFSVWY